MGMDSYILLENYMENGIRELQNSAREIRQYAENEDYGLAAIKKSISGNKGGSLLDSVCLKKIHSLKNMKSESVRVPPTSPDALVFDVEEGVSGIIKLFSIKFTTTTTASETSQDFPFILREKDGNELFNFYIHQPRHSGSSGTCNTTISVHFNTVDNIDTYKLYDDNNNASTCKKYAFSDSNIIGNNVYSSSCDVGIIVPPKGLAFNNGLELYLWISYGYNGGSADCKMIYEKA